MRRLFPVLLGVMLGCVLTDPYETWMSRWEFPDGVTYVWKRTAELEVNGVPTERFESTAYMRYLRNEYRRGFWCQVFEGIEETFSQTLRETLWFANTDTALFFVDVVGDYALIPIFRAGETPRYRIGPFGFTSLEELLRFSAALAWGYFPNQGLEEVQKTLRYPLAVGQEWTVFRRPWHRTRRVIGTEDITVPAGSFYTLAMEMGDDIERPGGEISFVGRDWITGSAWVKKVLELEILVVDPSGRIIHGLLRDTWELLETR